MFDYFYDNVNSLRINPEMLKYLNDYTKNHLEQICESQKFALTTSSSSSDDPEIKNLKLLMAVSLLSFLAGLSFRSL